MEFEILEYLKTYATIIQNPTVPYLQFIEFLHKQADASKNNILGHMVNNHKEKLIPYLEILVNRRECILIKDAVGLKAVFIFQTAVQLILKKYENLEYGYSSVFPSQEQLEFKLPQDSVSIIDIKEEFIKLISNIDSSPTPIIKIIFPYNIDNILITKGIINTKLIKYSVNVLKNFFQGQMNIELVYNKLVSIFKGNEIGLNEMLKVFVTKPNIALESLLKPTHFSFKFWSHIANLALENLKEKSGMLAKEHGYCQAAYFIGYYIVYQKGIIQKEKEKKIDLKKINTRLKKEPYIYTLKDIYGFVDKSGVPFIKKYSKKLIDDYIDSLTTSFSDDINTLPAIVLIKLKNNNEYYILKDSIIPLFLIKVEEASSKIKEDLFELWTYYCKNFIKDKSMNYDFAFLIDLETRVKEEFPLLYTLLTNNMVLLAKNDPDIPENIRRLINRFIDEKNKLYELDMLLDLDRMKLIQEVRSRLPLYYTFPIISLFVLLLKWALGKKGKKIKYTAKKPIFMEKQDQDTALPKITNGDINKNERKEDEQKEKKSLSSVEYNRAILTLEEEILGKKTSIDTSLKILAEKWNPLIDPSSKADLVEDVNSLIRDFLRSLRKGFRVKPPDATRLRNLAKELSHKDTLQKIKQKEYLIRYVEIYMIKCLLHQR